MQAFLNDSKIKEAAIADLKANPVSKDGIEYLDYESRLGIQKEVGQWEDVIFEQLPPEDGQAFALSFLESIPIGADLSSLPARLVLWQWEDTTYGLKNIGRVKNDLELLGFCEELVTLYRAELNGTPIPPEDLQKLFAKVATAWDVSGERQRRASVVFARKWKWLGARKWAWIPTRGWSGAWKWLLAGTRNRVRGGSTTMMLAWTDAWKWHRFWESREKRISAFKRYFLLTISKI